MEIPRNLYLLPFTAIARRSSSVISMIFLIAPVACPAFAESVVMPQLVISIYVGGAVIAHSTGL